MLSRSGGPRRDFILSVIHSQHLRLSLHLVASRSETKVLTRMAGGVEKKTQLPGEIWNQDYMDYAAMLQKASKRYLRT